MAKKSEKSRIGGRDKAPTPERPTEAFKRTRQDHATEVGQDYVELIDDLLRANGEARLVDIAQHMGVTHVSASRIIARLQREGLIQTKPYRAIFLTNDGKRLAEEVRTRHEVVLNLLRAIGVPEAQALIDAEGIEHHISDVTFEAICAFLDTRRG